MLLIAFFSGLAVGVALIAWRIYARQPKRRRIPRPWPMKVRPLINSREQRVWVWLNKVMFDQQVLIKLPVTRFTAPTVQKDAEEWYKLLNGVYCTFTVCGLDGKVVGCVDVPSLRGLSLSNQTLKHSLLEQCNIRYWVIDPNNLPHVTRIRTAFLGDKAITPVERSVLHDRFQNVRDNLQAAVTRRRNHKLNEESGMGELCSVAPPECPENLTPTPSAWGTNSFVTPMDSRAIDLELP